MTKPKTLEFIQETFLSLASKPFALVGTKSDVEFQLNLKAIEWASLHGSKHFLTNKKQGLMEPINYLVSEITRRIEWKKLTSRSFLDMCIIPISISRAQMLEYKHLRDS